MYQFLKKYGKDFKGKKDGESMADAVMKNVSVQEIREQDARVLISICTYYRIIRNQSVHVDDEKKLTKVFKEVLQYKQHIRDMFPKLIAPNAVDNIKFDDFILYSRAVKKFAEIVLESIQYDVSKIIEDIDINHFRQYINNEPRLKQALKREVMFKYIMDSKTIGVIVEKTYNKMILE